MNRSEAWELLAEYTKGDGLRKHALAVEACMRAYARKFDEEEEIWGVVGLLPRKISRLPLLMEEEGRPRTN